MKNIFDSKVFIDGEQMLRGSGYQVKLVQNMEDHHSFSITFLARRVEGFSSALMDNSLGFIGKKISLGINGKFEFVGLITNVSLSKNDGSEGTITISGHSPTILLSNSYQCFSYEEGKTFEEVIKDTLQGYPGDFVKMTFGSNTGITLPYTVQYNESDYTFIKRLCQRYGIWNYYNNTEYCIGRTGEKKVTGVYGKSIKQFSLSAALRDQQFNLIQHDWVNNTLLSSASSDHSVNGNHAYVSQVKQESESLYGKVGNYYYVHGHPEYEGQKGLDTYTKASTLGGSSGMLTASGVSQLPELRLGDTLAIEGYNFERLLQRDVYGEFMITSITHVFDHSGEYQNYFEAVPDKTEGSYSANAYSYPTAEAQRAIVMDTADPDGLGRVKVQFPWQQLKGTTTPWIKIQTPYGGGGKGFYFVPETGEEVLVGFEGGNAERPYVKGAGYNKNAKSPFADPDNNLKGIQTRSGNKVIMNDKDGSITIADPSGNAVVMQGNGEMIIKAPNKLALISKDINILASNNLNIISKPTGDGQSGGEGIINVLAQKSMTTEVVEETLVFSAKQKISLESLDSEIASKAKTNVTIGSKDKINIETSGKIKLNGKTETEISGGEVKLNS